MVVLYSDRRGGRDHSDRHGACPYGSFYRSLCDQNGIVGTTPCGPIFGQTRRPRSFGQAQGPVPTLTRSKRYRRDNPLWLSSIRTDAETAIIRTGTGPVPTTDGWTASYFSPLSSPVSRLPSPVSRLPYLGRALPKYLKKSLLGGITTVVPWPRVFSYASRVRQNSKKRGSCSNASA